MADYEPEHGRDYLIDFYAVIEAERDAPVDELHKLVNERTKEWHPDRLQGLAPELIAQGDRMTRLLNQCRAILLDETSRAEYDLILTDWSGPISRDGRPVILADRFAVASYAQMSSDEIETKLDEYMTQAKVLMGYDTDRLQLMEQLMADIGDDVSPLIRGQYDAALAKEDQLLAIDMSSRAQMLGVEDVDRFDRIGYNTMGEIEQAVEEARATEVAAQQALASGSVVTRLALLSGDTAEGSVTELASVDHTESSELTRPEDLLPHYYDDQATITLEIAKKRQQILEKRLANMAPEYPELDSQPPMSDNFIIGIRGGGVIRWIGMSFFAEENHAESFDIGDKDLDRLNAELYDEIFERGVNVLTIEVPENIEPKTVLELVIERHIDSIER